LRGLLVSSEFAFAVILLAGAFLFMRSLHNLQTQPLGMDTQNIVTAELTLGQQKYSQAAQRLAFFEQLELRLKRLPGISSVALSDSLPPNAPARTMPFVALQADGQAPLSPEQGIGGVVGWRSVTPDYFSVLNIPFLRGRAFEESDRKPGAGAIVLNQALASRLFPDGESLGKNIRFRLDEHTLTAPLSVVGVTRNTQNQGLGGQAGGRAGGVGVDVLEHEDATVAAVGRAPGERAEADREPGDHDGRGNGGRKGETTGTACHEPSKKNRIKPPIHGAKFFEPR